MRDGKCHVCRRDAIGRDGICSHCGTNDAILTARISNLLNQQDELNSLRTQLSALTEERDRLKNDLSMELSRSGVLTWALTQILGWRELRETRAFPIERVEEIARDALALSLSPLPESEAEKEVLRAAEEVSGGWETEGIMEHRWFSLTEKRVFAAVRKFLSLRNK